MPHKSSRQVLQELVLEIQVTLYLNYREYLQALYDATKARVVSYSYLRFADDLGFSATNVLRLIICGQRPLTEKSAKKIAKSLALHGDQLRYWHTLVGYANARLPADREKLFRVLLDYKSREHPHELNALEAEYFQEWYHPVIREMVGLADFDGNPEWIQQRLAFPLRIEPIKRSLRLLSKLRVIHFDPQTGCYTRAGHIKTSREVDSLALIRYHQTMIDMGRESITRIDVQYRDIQAVTVNLPIAALAQLKGRIQELISETLSLETQHAQSSTDRDVIQLNIQMFPFTQSAGKKREEI